MQKIKSFISSLFGLFLLIGMATLCVYIVKYVANYISMYLGRLGKLNTALAVAIVTGFITMLCNLYASIVTFKTKQMEYRHLSQMNARAKMDSPYKQFVDIILDLLMSTKNKKPISDQQLTKMVTEFSKQVILYGSNDVIKKWSLYRRSVSSLTVGDHLVMLEDILVAIRADFGFNKNQMQSGDIVSMFINDVDEILPSNTSRDHR